MKKFDLELKIELLEEKLEEKLEELEELEDKFPMIRKLEMELEKKKMKKLKFGKTSSHTE